MNMFTYPSVMMADFGDVEIYNSPVEYLNHILENGVKSLDKCKSLREALLVEQGKLQDKVNIGLG